MFQMSISDCVRSLKCGCSNSGSGWRMIGVDLLQACCNSDHLVVGFIIRVQIRVRDRYPLGQTEYGRISINFQLVHFYIIFKTFLCVSSVVTTIRHSQSSNPVDKNGTLLSKLEKKTIYSSLVNLHCTVWAAPFLHHLSFSFKVALVATLHRRHLGIILQAWGLHKFYQIRDTRF